MCNQPNRVKMDEKRWKTAIYTEMRPKHAKYDFGAILRMLCLRARLGS